MKTREKGAGEIMILSLMILSKIRSKREKAGTLSLQAGGGLLAVLALQRKRHKANAYVTVFLPLKIIFLTPEKLNS